MDSVKKSSPLKVVSPIIKKYSTHRQSKFKQILKFPKIVAKKQRRDSLKTIHELSETSTKHEFKTTAQKKEPLSLPVLDDDSLSLHGSPICFGIEQCEEKEEKTDDDICEEDKKEGGPEPVITEAVLTPEKEILSPSNINKTKKKNVSHSGGKKKNVKQYKNIEATLALLEPEPAAAVEKRESYLVQNYFAKVNETLDAQTYQDFVLLISTFQDKHLSVVDMYRKLSEVLTNYPDLLDEFVIFLTAEQAYECGKFMEYLTLTKMREFLQAVEVYFSKSPHQIRKIQTTLINLSQRPNVTLEDVCSSVLPLLKSSPLLTDYFQQLIPNGRPPESLMTDFVEVNCVEGQEEESVDILELPEVEDQYGNDSCICECHNVEDDKYKSRYLHCIPCGTKYLNGKIFLQVGKILKPAKVVFDDYDSEYHRNRLSPGLLLKRERKGSIKENLSPTKSNNVSSDELKSDLEDENDKGKHGKFAKSPKKVRTSSPKRKDKCIKQLFLKPPMTPASSVAPAVVDLKEKVELHKDKKLLSPVFGESVVGNMPPSVEKTVEDKSETEKALDMPPMNTNVVMCAHPAEVIIKDEFKVFETTVVEIKNEVAANHCLNVAIPSEAQCAVESAPQSTSSIVVLDIKNEIETKLEPLEADRSFIIINSPKMLSPVLSLPVITDNQNVSSDQQSSVVLSSVGNSVIFSPQPVVVVDALPSSLPILTQTIVVVDVAKTNKNVLPLPVDILPLADEKQSAKSPPVLSIPESAASSVLPDSTQPILTLLAHFDKTSKEEAAPLEVKEPESVKIEPGQLEEDRNILQTLQKVPEIINTEPWQLEEDRIILQTLQNEPNCDETFLKIGQKIPNRSIADIKKRFETLMTILYEMKESDAS